MRGKAFPWVLLCAACTWFPGAQSKALTPLGPNASRAVPSLILAFEEFPGPTVGRPVAEALAAIGPAARAALPALIKVVSITTADQFLLHDVSTAIVALGDPANPAMIRTALSFHLGRSKAPETLDLDGDALIPARLPAIAACLQDADEFVRLRAAIMLQPEADGERLAGVHRFEAAGNGV